MLSIRQLFQALLVSLLPIAGAVQAGEPVTLMHVHGLAYSADGRQLMIPSHHGLAIYSNGRWSKAAGRTTTWGSRPPATRCTAADIRPRAPGS